MLLIYKYTIHTPFTKWEKMIYKKKKENILNRFQMRKRKTPPVSVEGTRQQVLVLVASIRTK